MYLERMILKNFRSHQHTVIDCEQTTIVKAPNGGGKSSLLMAAEYALTSRCAMTDAAGRGAQSLIRLGEKQFSVELQLLLNGARCNVLAERSANSSSWMVGTATGKHATAVIEKNIASISAISACLNAHRILEMVEDERIKLLLSAVLAAEPVKLPDDELLNGVSDGYVREAADIDRLYKYFYDMRADANREVKALGDVQTPARPEGVPEADLETVKAQLRERTEEHTQLVDKRGRATAEYLMAKNRYDAAKAQKDVFDKDILSNAEVKKLQKTLQNTAEAKKLDTQIEEKKLAIQVLREQITLASARLEKQSDTCQACGQPLADAEQTRKDLQATIATETAKVKDFEDDLGKLQIRRADLGDPQHAQERWEKHSAAIKQIGTAEEVLKAGEPVAPKMEELDAEVKALADRIDKGRDILAKVGEYEAQVKLHKAKLEKKEALAKKAMGYDRMVQFFGPESGLRGQLVGDKLPKFVSRVNEVLSGFGFTCSLSLNPYSLLVSTQGGLAPQLELSQLSESEQFRFLVGFQVALAEYTGVKFVIVDRADMLIGEELRASLTAALRNSQLDQVIILAAGEHQETYPDVEGVKFIELTNCDGVTSVLETAHAI